MRIVPPVSRSRAISKSYAFSALVHGSLLVGAFVLYDASETTLYSDDLVDRLFTTTVDERAPVQLKIVKRPAPPAPVVKPKPKLERPPATRKKVRKKVPIAKPLKTRRKSARKATQPPKTRRAVTKVIGARSKESAPRDVAKGEAVKLKAAGPVGEQAATPEAKPVDTGKIVRLERRYYGTLSSFLKRNYEYPRRARIARVEGVVLIEIIIDSKGKILRRKIVRSSGSQMLDEAALASIAGIATVPAPPQSLPWSRRAVRVPFKYHLRT
jgi:periplasmic protein TonB